MEQLAHIELALDKSIKKGDKESLLSLFGVAERFKRMELMAGAAEDTNIKVVLEGLGEVDLKLGADMAKGQSKTLMTLFWYSERTKPFTIKRDAAAGETIAVNMWLLT